MLVLRSRLTMIRSDLESTLAHMSWAVQEGFFFFFLGRPVIKYVGCFMGESHGWAVMHGRLELSC